MKISELIAALKRLQDQHGDLETRYQTLSHRWPPEPVVRSSGDTKFVLLNP